MNKNIFYIISEKDDCENLKFLKIGITDDIEKRLRTIISNNPNNISLEYMEIREDAYELEQWLLSIFNENIEKGEWLKNIKIKDIRKKIFEFHD